jgi:DNA helicase-2/ATP-dependent DNA helicase PcrA
MTICFRCPEKTIKGADEFIRREPKLNPHQRNSEPIWILDCKSDVQEARYISEWIGTAIKNNQYQPRDIAILYRGGDVADKIADKLAKANIQVIRPSPEETKHVRIACLRLIVDRRDSLALRVCLASKLAKGIGRIAIKRLRDLAEATNCSFWDALITAKNENSFKRWHKPLQGFNQVFEDLSATASKSKMNNLLYKVAKGFGYEKEPRIVEPIKRSESIPNNWNLYDFIRGIRGLKGEKAADPRESGEEEANAVLFITMHSVKGLERKVIFVLGMEKGSFPQLDGDIEEQRRLCYVAMTRAEEKLFLCYAKKREGKIAQGFKFYDRSPFIFEIPELYREFITPDS